MAPEGRDPEATYNELRRMTLEAFTLLAQDTPTAAWIARRCADVAHINDTLNRGGEWLLRWIEPQSRVGLFAGQQAEYSFNLHRLAAYRAVVDKLEVYYGNAGRLTVIYGQNSFRQVAFWHKSGASGPCIDQRFDYGIQIDE